MNSDMRWPPDYNNPSQSPFMPSTIAPAVIGRPPSISVMHHRVNLVLKLDIVLRRVNPLGQVSHHAIISCPPKAVTLVVTLIGSSFDLARLDKLKIYPLLQKIVPYGHGHRVISKTLPEDLFGYTVTKLQIEMIPVDDDLIAAVILDKPATLLGIESGGF